MERKSLVNSFGVFLQTIEDREGRSPSLGGRTRVTQVGRILSVEDGDVRRVEVWKRAPALGPMRPGRKKLVRLKRRFVHLALDKDNTTQVGDRVEITKFENPQGAIRWQITRVSRPSTPPSELRRQR